MRTIVLFSLLLLIPFVASAKSNSFKKSDGIVYIPTGTIEYNEGVVSISGFFMSDHEVTNLEYRTFLNNLKTQGREADFLKAMPDTAAWHKAMPWAHMEPMMNMYFWHPAYDQYPVVNISVEGAEMYCAWLTEKMKAKYGSEFIQPFRLPTKYEWAAAAMGGGSRVVYSWGFNELRNSKGCYMANFRPLGDEYITVKDSVPTISEEQSAFYAADGAFTTAKVKSYFANAYGLYNMCGNVAELVTEPTTDAEFTTWFKGHVAAGGNWNSTGYDLRVTSTEAFEKPNPFVGFRPVMTYKITDDSEL